ncbi:hypothetical protein HaLaN_16685 [Haematococcus lacustris]|uniref:Uncharacterized protein n=1 Tax=Haematococcus lacustris TaxID=44745 RepID=A0A699ZD36_HAELA|nr:hypothetical protein HaLaN_16685 [Haematococcus lacustris]
MLISLDFYAQQVAYEEAWSIKRPVVPKQECSKALPVPAGMTGRGTRVSFAAAGITPALRQRLKGAIGAGRANPYIVITPLLVGQLGCDSPRHDVFAAILAVGVWGVLRGADLDAAAARTAAQSRLDGLALNLELSFSRAALPVRQLVDLIQHFPHYATIMSMWGDWLPNWWAAAPGSQSVSMVMAPQGIITAAYPDTPVTRTLLGIDILDGVYR